MHLTENEIYHIYNRGNRQQQLFFCHDDYIHFLSLVRKQIMPYCDLLAWCLMPNHFHLMIRASEYGCTERPSFGGKPMQLFPYRLGICLSTYSQQMNRKNATTGSSFQQKTKAISVTEAMQRAVFTGTRMQYVINLMHYLHQNPCKARLVQRPEDWPYSSFRDYCGFRNGTLCKKELLMTLTGYCLATFHADSYAFLHNAL